MIITIKLTCIMETKKIKIAKATLRKKYGVGGIKHPDFRLYYKAIVIKTVLYCHKNRHTNQWNRVESPEIIPGTCSHWICGKGGKTMQWRRDSLFNKWYWKNWTAARKRMKLEYSLTTCAKINSKQIKNKVLYKILKP